MGGIHQEIPLSFTPSPKVATEIQSFVLEFLREVTPVRTGLLRSAWEVTVSGASVVISNPTHYASFLNGGTRKMRARDMTGQASAALEPFAERRSYLAQLLESEPELKFVGTGDADLDAAILGAAGEIVGGLDLTKKQLGLYEVGARTLLTWNKAARQYGYSRATELDELYGTVDEAFGISTKVQTGPTG